VIHFPRNIEALIRMVCVSAVSLAALSPTLAPAQTPPPADTHALWEFRVAANEEVLWLAGLRGSQSVLTRRTATDPFDRGRQLNGRVATMTADDGDVFVFFETQGFYRYDQEGQLRQTDLPGRVIPIDIVGADGALYALVPSAVAAELREDRPSATAPSSGPAFDPGDAPLSIVRYDGNDWTPVSACPPTIHPHPSHRLRPRLCPTNRKLLLVWIGERASRIHYARLDPETARWLSSATLGVSKPNAFWIARIDGVPTLVTATDDAPADEQLSAYRLLGQSPPAQLPPFKPAPDLRLSPIPQGLTLTRYTDVFGFNQHLGLLATDSAGTAYLRFARFAATPLEATTRLDEVFTEQQVAERTQTSLQLITLAVMVVVLVGLFVFRRGSMVNALPLPPNVGPALTLQRLGGWLVDFVPFAWSAAAVVGIDALNGLQQLTAWGVGGDPVSNYPPTKILLWWGLACGGHTLYMLVMELLTRRTVGKVLSGVRVLSETGARPTLWQTLARNALRPLELMPQFWVLGLLILLSRNRQRLGDIFARTVVVRKAPGAGTPPPQDEPRSPQSPQQPD